MADMIDARTDRTGAATSQRRQEIVDAAIVTFAERGYEGASTREIAELVGLKQGHLYYYFPAKQELLFTVVDDLHQSFLDGLDTWRTHDESTDELWSTMEGHVRLVCARRRQVRVAYESVRFLEPERRQLIVDKRNAYEQEISRLIAARLPSGQLDAAPMVTRAVLGIVNWVYQWFSDEGALAPDQVARQFADLACKLVTHPPERPETME